MAVIKTKEETFVSRKGGNFENRVDVFLLLSPPPPPPPPHPPIPNGTQ